jgi:hypothetical protein
MIEEPPAVTALKARLAELGVAIREFTEEEKRKLAAMPPSVAAAYISASWSQDVRTQSPPEMLRDLEAELRGKIRQCKEPT